MYIVMCMLVRNERECLEAVLPTLPPAGPSLCYDRVVAIDGGSTDGTQQLLEDSGVEVISQKTRGRGAAIIEAINFIQADAYILFSPDGNEDVKDFPKFRDYLEQGADLVIASRMMAGAYNEEDESFFKFRKWANLSFNAMANIYFGRGKPFVSDSINGYRAITKSLANKLSLDANDYTIEYQMTMRALKYGAKIIEFPTHEYPRIAGFTGAPSIPTGIRFVKRFFLEVRKGFK